MQIHIGLHVHAYFSHCVFSSGRHTRMPNGIDGNFIRANVQMVDAWKYDSSKFATPAAAAAAVVYISAASG